MTGLDIRETDLKSVAQLSGILDVEESFNTEDFQERCNAILPNPEDKPEDYVQSYLTLKYFSPDEE